jgi:hypothetical protein
MTHRFFLLLVFLPTGLYPQTLKPQDWNRVELLCGRLLRAQEVPTKGADNTFTEKTKPIKNTTLRLYHRTEDKPCCVELKAVAQANSTRDGRFEFKNAVPGAYWIVTSIEGTDYKIAVTYAPDNKGGSKCSDVLYSLKKDHLEIERMIQVD